MTRDEAVENYVENLMNQASQELINMIFRDILTEDVNGWLDHNGVIDGEVAQRMLASIKEVGLERMNKQVH